MSNHIDDDPGIGLTPMGKRAAVILLIVGIIVALVIVLNYRGAGAAPLAGNRGGCPLESRRYNLACQVQDSGVGWVSGTCLYGEYFLAQTARTFTPGPVHVTGCVDDTNTIYSAPGFRLRITK
jgi:hypothetical protein